MAIAKSADHAIKIEALINGILYAQNEGQVLRGFNEISKLVGARPVSTFEAIFSKKNTRNPTIKLAIIAAARNEVNRKPATAAPAPVVTVTNSRGIPFTVKRVLRGGDTLVEIYDARHNQLVGSWAARTIMQLADGLNMGHHPDWVLDTDNVATIRTELLGRKTNPIKGNKTMTHAPIRSIDVQAVEWFQKSMGNSYHAVQVSVNGKHVYMSPKTYGYGEHYLTTAAEGLAELGYNIPTRGSIQNWARDNGVALDHYKREVKTERALKEFAAPTPKRKAPSRAKNPREGADTEAARELYFYAINTSSTSDLLNATKHAVARTATRKGGYDGMEAIKSWERAAKSMGARYSDDYGPIKFSGTTLNVTARMLENHTRDDVKALMGSKATRAKNPLVKGEHYHVVAVKAGKVAAHWTGTAFDTNKAKAKSYMTKAGATNAANAMAGKLAAGYQVGVQTIVEKGGRVTRPKK